jgi:hypothetical protein
LSAREQFEQREEVLPEPVRMAGTSTHGKLQPEGTREDVAVALVALLSVALVTVTPAWAKAWFSLACLP